MADFLLLREPDTNRRERIAALASGILSAEGSRSVGSHGAGDWILLWATYAGAPSRLDQSDAGFTTLLLGEPLEHDADSFATPEAVGSGLRGEPVPQSYDGFHVAVSFDHATHDVAIGGDITGDFPIYHASRDGSFLAASRQDVLLLDERVDASIDRTGLAGILHSCGLLGHRTLHAGIARLPARHVLRWSPENGSRYVAQRPLEASDDLKRLYLEAGDAELSEAAWTAGRTAIRRMTPSTARIGMYLSGGLDSRNMAGLAHSEGWNPVCFTFGAPWEIEAVIAGQTARALGWKRKRLPEPLGEFPRIAEQLVDRERLANGLGFSFGPVHLDPSCLTANADRILTGLKLDYLTKGSSVFEKPQELLEMGFTSEEMDRLTIDSPLAEPWQDLAADLRRRYAAREGFETMALDHRARFHVGSNFWRTAQGAWPVSPVFSRSFHTTLMSMPARAFPGRHLQKVSIVRKCPPLGRVPLDVNETTWASLDPKGADARCTFELRIVRKLTHLAGKESRYFSATYDLESEAWRIIRDRAEPGRKAVESLLNAESLSSILPPPGRAVPLDPAAPIPSSAPRKVLLGLMLLAHRRGID